MFLRLWKKRKRGYQIDQYDQGITAAPTTELSWVLLSSCTWTNDLDGLWTKTDPDIPAEGNFDQDIGENSVLDLDTEPLRYEDVLQQYLEKDPTLSAGDIPSIADLNVDSATDMEVNPKTKEQIISELVPKIQMQGMTPARATIAAQEMYTKAEARFGDAVDMVLEAYQPGQDPGKFLDGFQNAYLSGKIGSKAALENSTAAAYLTEEQRTAAYTLGQQAGRGLEKGRNDVRIMEVSRFNTKGDPMREVTGPGVNSHPTEIQQMCSEMERYGVEIVRRGSGMAYSPGILPGSPGQFIIEENASYSAWLHEFKHFCDIRDAGFPGMRIFMDTEKCIQMEIDAYSIEISMAESVNRPDIAERLRELMKNEVARFGYSVDDQ